jgi:hypothetical protein
MILNILSIINIDKNFLSYLYDKFIYIGLTIRDNYLHKLYLFFIIFFKYK